MATVRKGGPLDSKGKPKTGTKPGPLVQAAVGLGNKIASNNREIMEQSRQITLAKERGVNLGTTKYKAPTESYKGTFAPLKSVDLVPTRQAAPKAAVSKPAAAASKPAPAKPAASSAQTFGSAFAAARKSGAKEFEYKGKKYTTAMKGEAPKPAAKPAEPMARPAAAPIAKMESKAAQVESKEPVMAKREVKIETPEKKKRLFARLRERAKGRKSSGMNPMSGFSVATASDYLEGGKGKTMMGGGMVKKYSGGGKMEEYKKGGKMDKKKAFMEMIAKLKAKKK
jgi:hypothetical protein